MRRVRTGVARAASALLLASTLVGFLASGAGALNNPGGTVGPAARVSTRGTGGTEYTVAPKRRVAGKPASRRPPPRRPAPRKPAQHKPVPRKPAPPNPAPAPSGVPSPAQTAGEGAVFPVVGPHSFGGPENRFGAARAGHTHQGQDVLAGEGLPVLAPLAGTIVTTGYQSGGAGWYLAEHSLDGLDFFYAHCEAGSLTVTTEARVRSGEQLCRVGQTGDATAPHLHFEVWVGGWRAPGGYPIDPLPYLQAWEQQ